jgi:hypothetical protein
MRRKADVMPFASLVIDYETEGDKKRQYTFGVKQVRNGTSNQPIDTLFWDTIKGPHSAEALDSWTDGVTTQGTPSLLEAILWFLRSLHSNKTRFTGAYLSDGVTPGPETGPFATMGFSLPGVWTKNFGPMPARESIAPANQTLMLVKDPVTMGVRKGHQFLRFVMADSWITYGSADGTTFDTAAFATNMNAAVQAATAGSKLNMFMQGVSYGSGTVYFGQLQYYSTLQILLNPALKNAIKAVQPIKGWSVKDANERASQKGKRRKPTAAQAVKYFRDLGLPVDTEALTAALVASKTPVDTGIKPAYDPTVDLEPAPENFHVPSGVIADNNGDIEWSAGINQQIPGLIYPS